VVTAVVTLDWAQASRRDLDQSILLSGPVAELKNGQGVPWMSQDRVSLRDLLYAALLQSDNSAAQSIADYVGSQLPGLGESGKPAVAFIAQMNALARKMNLKNTRFLNPHGLEGLERKLPYSCAEDMAQLTAYAMSHPAFRFIVSQRERRITLHRADGSSVAYQLRNTNELLGEHAIDGVKTGTTRQAGQCLAISAGRAPEVRQEGEEFFRTPRRLEVVVLGSQNRFAEARHLLERGWHRHQEWAAAGRPLNPKTGNGIREKLGL
jgi:D-alanyl-D-alanine carboxypeptidase (penicillin-binding protein 5/6)